MSEFTKVSGTGEVATAIELHGHKGSPQVRRRNSMGGDKSSNNVPMQYNLRTVYSPDDASDTRIDVSVSCEIRKLISISVEEQTFTAEVFVRSSWVDPRLQDIYDEDGCVFFADPLYNDDRNVNCWSPRLQVTNIRGVPDYFESWNVPADGTRARDYFMVGRNDKSDVNKWRVSQIIKFQAKFMMKMRLRSFPLDEHYLEIRLKAHTPYSVDTLHPLRHVSRSSAGVVTMSGVRTASLRKYDPTADGSLNKDKVNRFHQEGFFEEWSWWASNDLHFELGTTSPKDSIHGATYQTMVVRLHVVRDPWFYVINVMLVHGAISTAALSTLTFTDFDQRIDSIFQLITAAIAHKFVANQNLPKLPHATKLDYYILFGLAMMLVVVIEAVCFNEYASEHSHDVDRIIGGALGIVWAIFNLYYVSLFISFWLYGKSVNERGWRAGASTKNTREDRYTPPEACCPCFRLFLPWSHHYSLHEREEHDLQEQDEIQRQESRTRSTVSPIHDQPERI